MIAWFKPHFVKMKKENLGENVGLVEFFKGYLI
jgi:hypothetical protein